MTDTANALAAPTPESLSPVLAQCEFYQTGVVIPEYMPFDDWLTLMQRISAIQKSAMWWLGDALKFGEDKYGERYAQVSEATEYSASTLDVAALVAKKFPPERRKDNVGWSHHLEVIGLPDKDQDSLLSQAAVENWSTRALRNNVRVRRVELQDTDSAEFSRAARFAYAEWQDVASTLRRYAEKYPIVGKSVLGFVDRTDRLLKGAIHNKALTEGDVYDESAEALPDDPANVRDQ